ncbi:hypothetical protein Tco_0956307 [Tanacetum coccineum]
MKASFLKLSDVLNTTNKVSSPAVEEPMVASMAIDKLRIVFEDTLGSVPTTTDVLTLDSDKPGINNSGAVSFSNLLKGESNMRQVNFHRFLALAGNGSDVVISKESVGLVNKRFCSSIYGFFLGKRVAFPVVENYVKNA